MRNSIENKTGQPNREKTVIVSASERIRRVTGSDTVQMHEVTQRPTKAVMRALRDAAKRGALS